MSALRPEADCLSSYTGCDRRRISAIVVRACGAGLLAATFALGGCSYPVGSLWEKNKPEPTEITGSIAPTNLNAQALLVSDRAMPPQADLHYARVAAVDVLARGGKDTSQPWENPDTGARGSVTPVASAYASGGQTCRDFLVSHVQGRVETWLQGDACRSADTWEVRSLRAWKRS